MALFAVGDKVEKVGGDYTFVGHVVAVFAKISGAIRLVVEDDRGVLHGGVVGTLMSNFSLEKAMESLTIPFVRTNVGDRYVLETLKKQKL